ncbi:phage infection protein [Microbacterium sorbitolivorans]|uniref:YhgE/Pip domain-containing protein n=1 Tax=Microbacterium sorbitolivorans TaxID=1867410 RepID=A0A367Y2R3_9MICO|nr:YhgE/Pip domain-containing protein [Microbacterium sorbitolivorans]RCK60186.1 YhgE/Pip domain-containing protein [Microbacterium sorbitolivorans]GGF48666.1 phage infection protein [Microbacterium sorbitolivorans]
MRDILHLTRRDIRRATSSVMAVIVIFGLVVIPSLFTWFNVIASWDPFSNTKNLKVAVASADEGYLNDLVPIRINIGDKVLSELRANDDLDWVITTEDDAIDGTKSGEYYAALVLPASFSTDMMTFYSDDVEHTSLAYYTNEKKNALAPKITDQGADGVSQQINEVFTETLSDIALSVVSSLSDYLTDVDTQAALTRLEARIGGVATQLRGGAQTADMFTSLLESTIPLVDGASSLITSSGSAFEDASSAVGGGAAAVDELGDVLASSTQALSDAISRTAAGYDAVGARIDELFAQGAQLSDSQVQVIDTLAGRMQDQIDHYTELRNRLENEIRPILPDEAQDAFSAVLERIDAAIAAQQSAHDRVAQAGQDIADGSAERQAKHDEITASIDAAKQALQSAQDSYTGSLQPKLDELAATLSVIGADVSSIGDDLSAAADRLAGSAGGLRDTLTGAQESTQRISESLTETAETFDKVEAALADAAKTGDLSALNDIIGSDPSVLATSLAQPLRVDRTAVFPIVSFGAGMAPLYMALALWVGALLMTVAIRVDVNADTLPDRPELSPTKKYLGRYGIFGLIGLAQSTLVTLGLILFIQVEPANAFLLILAGWVTSLVFTLLIYTAVVALGNAGKALAVLVLVIQVSGSGGAYPLQLLPEWFQNISPFLPATHAVAAMRSAIAGVYASDFWISLGTLALFVVPALLVGLVLRRPLMSFTQGLSKAIESTKLMSPS